jgi:hypothetical protein
MAGGTHDPISIGDNTVDFLLLKILAKDGWAPEYYDWAEKVIILRATNMTKWQKDLLFCAIKGCVDFFHRCDNGRFTQLSSRLTANLP